MANLYSRIILHATFSTRGRRRLITPAAEHELYPYLGGALNAMGCKTIKVNGFQDHVHLLFHCPPRLCISDVIRDLKKNSGSWAREHFGSPHFHWQEGGGIFSVDHHAFERTIRYLANQHAHHQGLGYAEEYRTLLRENQVEFDERYVLDPEAAET
jgi:REP element-mobilizing transposase RayT